MTTIYDVAIIGSGIAGLSASIYCARLNLKSIVIGSKIGGNLINASLIENYPGINKISGTGLIKKVTEHAKEYNLEILEEDVEKISKEENTFKINTKKKEILSKTIIFCTGTKLKKAGIKGEKEFAGKGVHYCALCDGFFYKDKTVAVFGGGDSAVKEAFLLSKYAEKVYIISETKLKPEPINFQRLKKETKIEILEEIKVQEIKGDRFVNSIILNKKFKNSNLINLDGIFIEMGHLPISQLAADIGVKTNADKEIITDKNSQTNIKGIFAAGDVTNNKIKQAITAVGEAVKAAYSAYEYLHGEELNY